MGRSVRRSGRGSTDERTVGRVSDAMAERYSTGTVRRRLRAVEVRVLVDAPRWGVIVGLAAAIFLATALLGAFGPVTVREYLLSGTSVANAYIELQPGIITAITVVLAINQLVLSPEFGALGHQHDRLEDVLSHRRSVEESAGVVTSPTDPAGFLATIVDAIREHAGRFADATGEDPDLDRRVEEFVDGVEADVVPVSDALEDDRFGDVEMLGAAIHCDTNRHIHLSHRLRRTYGQSLSVDQERALDDLDEALEQFTIAREYFRTLYLQEQFIRFSRAMLLTGLPALVVAHYSVGIIGPAAFPGSTFGVRNLLWFEGAAFAVTMLPVVVIVSYVARIVTLAETSIFMSPFDRSGRT